MENQIFTIANHENLAKDVYRLTLRGDTSAITTPGQFVNVRLSGYYLRRPLSVCDWQEGELKLVYKVLGHGTADMTLLPVGAELDLLCGLGNGYDMEKCGSTPLLIGGGAGVPPLYGLARRLIARGKKVKAAFGFNAADEIFLAEDFAALGCEVFVATMDGSVGVKGLVTAAMEAAGEYDYVYTCGPMPMLKAVCDATACSGQYSFEERMGCGFGACVGCTCKTKYGDKRICKDGPVLEKEEIIW